MSKIEATSDGLGYYVIVGELRAFVSSMHLVPDKEHNSNVSLTNKTHELHHRALTSTLALFASTAPVFATPSYFQDHVDLLETVIDVGVKVYVNSAHCDDGQFYGYYEPWVKVPGHLSTESYPWGS